MSEANWLEELLGQRYVFHCLQAGVRIADPDRARLDVMVGSLSVPPLHTIPDRAPEWLVGLFSLTNGAVFYCPDGTPLDRIGGHYGLVLVGADDVEEETERLKRWLLEDLETLVDEFGPGELERAATTLLIRRCAAHLAHRDGHDQPLAEAAL